MTCGIYKITNKITNKSYIGQSINIEDRIKAHWRTKDNTYIHHAIQKYGKENFNYCVLEECPIDKDILNQKEKHYIKIYNTLSPNGYNLTIGGDANADFFKRPVSKYTIDGKFICSYPSIKEAALDNHIDSRNIGQVLKKNCYTCGGYQWYYAEEDNIQTEIKTNTGYDKIPVCQHELTTGKYLYTFDSFSSAMKFCHGKDAKGIKKCCENFNQGYSAFGYMWSFLKDKQDFLIPYDSQKIHSTISKAVKQIDIKTNKVINIFNSAKEAARFMNMKSGGNSAILRVCHGKQKTCCGYRWEFI